MTENVLISYLGENKPNLISEITAHLTEIGGEAVHYFNPTDINEMAESIRKVCEDSEFRLKLKQCGPDYAKKFNWDSSFKSHMDLFETILN